MDHFSDDLGEEKEFDIEKLGSYGSFSTSSSYPIEYILTTFRPEELAEKLTFAKDVRPDKIDFDLLIQRDIDEDRVRGAIAPYIDPESSSESPAKNSLPKAVFFPPLLAAVVPVKNKQMGIYYQNEIATEEANRIHRRWGAHFRITFQKSQSSLAASLSSFDSEGNKASYQVKAGQVLFEAKKSVGGVSGVRLVVIDGQHRLKALQDVYSRNPEKIRNLLVPVCILFAPNSQERLKGKGILTISEVFRQLFVDVNSTSEHVGGHFNILLSDTNIGSLICRQFCSSILEDQDGKKKLAAIEWNTKSLKDSTIVKKDYSITSIGVIEKALRECMKVRTSDMQWWLSLKSVESRLYPDHIEKGTIECPEIGWEAFSAFQRKILSEQVSKYCIPTLRTIFFESDPYAEIFQHFKEELASLESKCDDSVKGLSVYTPVLEQIIDYAQIPDDKNDKDNKKAKAEYKSFSDNVQIRTKEANLQILRYALYQRGLFLFWYEMLQKCNSYSCDPSIAASITKIILNEAHSESNRKAFSSKHFYMQNSVFRGTAIITTDETRKSIKNLLGSFLSKPNVLVEIEKLIQGKMRSPEIFIQDLREYGDSCPAKFIGSFEKGYEKYFKKTYTVSEALSADEKDLLQKAENTAKLHRKEYRERKRSKEEMSNEFDNLVENYVRQASFKASEELRKELGLDLEIIRQSGEEEEESVD